MSVMLTIMLFYNQKWQTLYVIQDWLQSTAELTLQIKDISTPARALEKSETDILIS
jgi:hypothetical protein